jgi:nicotinamide riboside kinase
MRIFKIYVSGTHSTGKTQLVDKLSQELGKTFQILKISEIARKCPYAINLESSPHAQKWIFAEQLKSEIDCEAQLIESPGEVKFIVSDRSNIDNMAYAKSRQNRSKKGWEWVDDYLEFVYMNEARKTDTFYYITKISAEAESDGFRDTDSAWREEIQRYILDFYHELMIRHGGINIPFHRFNFPVKSVAEILYDIQYELEG